MELDKRSLFFIDEEKARTHYRKCAAGKYCGRAGIETGDILLEIDGQVIEDIFDYQFYVESEELLVVIKSEQGRMGA